MGALDGKVAIVTGGTSGIGEGIAELFVEEGAKVVVAARRQDEGAALEKRLGVRFIRTDVANEADVKAMIDQTVAWFGRVDCLVNNAALPAPMVSITEIDVATIDQLLAVNVRGVLLGIKHVAPVMLKQGSGSIINIGSMAGIRGGVSGHIYSATKGAVLALSRSAGAELGEKGVRVNCLSPGAIVTGIFAKAAGVEGSKADRLTDVIKNAFASRANDPAGWLAGRHRASGGLSRQRRLKFHQRPGHRGRRRPLERDQRLVLCRRHARRNVKAPQGGRGEALGARRLAKEPPHQPFGSIQMT